MRVATFLSVLACSRVVRCSSRLDDLSNGNSDGGTANDGSIDGNGSDAINQSADVFAADAVTPATPRARFCDNFDDRVAVLGAWDNVLLSGNGMASDLSISSAEFVSPPHSLHAQIPARSSGGSDISNINKDLPLHSGSMSVDFDMKVVGSQGGFNGFGNLVELGVSGYYVGSVTVGGGGDTVVDYWVNFADGGHIQPLYDLGPDDTSWHHFHYAAVYDPDNGSIVVTRDGASVANVSGVITYGNGTVPDVFNLAIGYSTEPTFPALDVYFDNVQVQ